MDKNDIIEYVMHTPHNTNRAVLSSMLNQLAEGGGGGSSDLSTAQVTIVNNTSGSLEGIYMPYILNANVEVGNPDIAMPSFAGGIPKGTSSYNAVLYKGSCCLDYVAYVTVTGFMPVEIAGSATKLFDGAIAITGDCTITMGGDDEAGGGGA